ncbi:type II secretion system F family protein [bacterium]|nr:type II secretion system F family protein [bacterium]
MLGQLEKKREKFMRAYPLYRFLMPWVRKLAKLHERFGLKEYQNNITQKLVSAGNPGALSALEFLAIKELLLIFTPIIGILILKMLSIEVAWYYIILFMLAYFYADQWLKDQIKKRHKGIWRGLPYSLDLITLSVEAGLDFSAAINKVVDKMKAGPLVEELFHMQQQIKLGSTRRDALKAMADRVNMQDLSAICTSLIQADQLGTSLGPILRVLSDQMRIKRMQIAEKTAMQAPVKMLLPLVGFIFPAVFVMLFGPIIIKLLQGGF